jgi:hypothetical protein
MVRALKIRDVRSRRFEKGNVLHENWTKTALNSAADALNCLQKILMEWQNVSNRFKRASVYIKIDSVLSKEGFSEVLADKNKVVDVRLFCRDNLFKDLRAATGDGDIRFGYGEFERDFG